MLVKVRPSNEALLKARVPGAQDQRGCPPILFTLRVARARGSPQPPRSPFNILTIPLESLGRQIDISHLINC